MVQKSKVENFKQTYKKVIFLNRVNNSQRAIGHLKMLDQKAADEIIEKLVAFGNKNKVTIAKKVAARKQREKEEEMKKAALEQKSGAEPKVVGHAFDGLKKKFDNTQLKGMQEHAIQVENKREKIRIFNMAKHLERSFAALQGLKTTKQEPWHITFATLNIIRLVVR